MYWLSTNGEQYLIPCWENQVIALGAVEEASLYFQTLVSDSVRRADWEIALVEEEVDWWATNTFLYFSINNKIIW
jgi:hypothetical protein